MQWWTTYFYAIQLTGIGLPSLKYRYWYVIREGRLYCYLTPEDLVTVDITQLYGYTVTPLIDQFCGKRFVLHLAHEDYVPLYLSLESRDDMDTWSAALEQSTHVHEEEVCTEVGVEATVNTNNADNSRRILSVKQKLLAEVLRQKEELEKKQAARRLACQNDNSWAQRRDDRFGTLPSKNGDVHICTVTRLKQRRMSTQIKMEAIQRQIGEGTKNGHKKSLFKIGKKKSQEDKNPQLVEQLEELSTTLKAIDVNLNSEGVVTKNNVMSSTVGFQNVSTESNLLRQSDSFEDEQNVQRSNSLKASVQRLAHRTFAKAGWRRNHKKSQSLHLDEFPSDDSSSHPEMIDLTTHSSDIISSISFSSSAEIVSTASSSDLSPLRHNIPSSPLSGHSTPSSSYTNSSPTSPTSPVFPGFTMSPKVQTGNPRDQGISAARAQMMSRSSSTDHSVSSSSFEAEPNSPRREVNPSIMAEINAFEELTKQVLSQRSALASH